MLSLQVRHLGLAMEAISSSRLPAAPTQLHRGDNNEEHAWDEVHRSRSPCRPLHARGRQDSHLPVLDRSRLLMSKLLGSLRPAAGAKLPQASSISSVHSPIEFGLSFTFYPTKSNPIESKAIGYPYPIRSKSIRIQVKKSNWIWIKPNPFPGLPRVILCGKKPRS